MIRSHQSFPCGHAASAFAGAAFLQRRYSFTHRRAHVVGFDASPHRAAPVVTVAW